MMYWVSTPWLIRKLYCSDCIWEMPSAEKKIYLTFDDGPHPSITGFVLDQLKQFNAKATFFCIGKNVVNHPDVYSRILAEGHAVGNHTFDHFNAAKTRSDLYLENIQKASAVIKSDLFRPPYGRISRSIVKKLSTPDYGKKTVMWSVLSGDFDQSLDSSQCLNNVMNHATAGSVIVFHDSEKAWSRLSKLLPQVLENLTTKGYLFDVIS